MTNCRSERRHGIHDFPPEQNYALAPIRIEHWTSNAAQGLLVPKSSAG
jgi:hypothetical protein